MLNFLMLVHNHQPIGNFDHVMEKAYSQAYKPFLDVFSDYDLKISLHISGPLLEWLIANHPEYIAKVRELVKAGKIEIVGSGFYEPILAAIPEEDAISQLSLYKSFLEKTFETEVLGSWLTERVWEPHLPKILKRGGYRYTVTDDYHFLRSGFDYEELDSYYLTDYDNHTIAVYPGSEALRYLMPFSTVDNIYSFFRSAYEKGIKTFIFADDGEKFGIWPETFKWVYEEGWLRGFFNFLCENRGWIKTTTFREHLENNEPRGCCYLPTTSYPELGEWALPTKSSVIYSKNLAHFKTLPNFSEIKPFFQGGQWKNFLTKYREARIMYRKMHYLSQHIRNKSEKTKLPLYKAQCNDAYWHGIFGGLYLPHLRRAINSHLVSAIKLAFKRKSFFDLYDFDLDGHDELFLKYENLSLLISPNDGGTIIAIDDLKKDLSLTDTLRRRQEPYHLKIGEAQKESHGAKTIHEQFKTKEAGLDRLIVYDRYNKSSFRCFLFSQFPRDMEDAINSPLHPISEGYYNWKREETRSGDLVTLSLSQENLFCEKRILVEKDVLKSSVNIQGAENYKFLGIEWNFNLFAPNAPDRYIFINDSEKHYINFEGAIEELNTLSLVDEWYGIKINFSVDVRSHLFIAPIYTVSLSEGGVEKTFQGTTFLFLLPLEGGSGKADINISIERRP